MSGGLGGSQKQSVKIPQWLENASQDVIARADEVSRLGYTPYMGPEVAAFNKAQEAAFNNNAAIARDIGITVPAGSSMPAATDFGGGVWGYGSHDGYKRNLDAFREEYPGQYDYMRSFFIDPVNGGSAGSTRRTGGSGSTTGGSGLTTGGVFDASSASILALFSAISRIRPS